MRGTNSSDSRDFAIKWKKTCTVVPSCSVSCIWKDFEDTVFLIRVEIS